MNLKIDIPTKTFVRFVAVLAGFALAAFLIVKLQKPLTLILVSVFLALALNPPVSRLSKLLPRQSRIGATAISYLVVVAIIGGFLVLVVPPVVQQSVKFGKQAPTYIDKIQDQQGPVRNFLARYGLESQLDSAIDNAKSQATSIAQNVGKGFVSSVGKILNGFVSVITVLVLTFLLLIEGPSWLERIWLLYTDSKKRERHKMLVKRMYRVVTGYVNGQVLVATIAATCSLIVLSIMSAVLDISYGVVLPLAGVIFFTSMIPMIGATLGAIVVSLVLLFSSWIAALVFLAYYIIYQQIENNLIQPVVQARTVELTALTVIVAIVIGANLYGFIGALVAIPVAGCLRVLFINYMEEREQKTDLKPENLFHKIKKALSGNK